MGCGGSTPAAAAVAPKGDGPTKKAASSERRSSFSIDQRMSLQFDRVMDDHVGLETLLKFAKKEFNEEQLLFWIDVMKMKRDLADTTIWETDGKNAAAPPVATASAAPVPASKGGGGAPDIFGGFDEPPTSNGGNAFDGDNMFDNDVATHSSGLGSADAVLSSEPPPEAATGDRAGFLRRRCAELIDKYLCNGADFQCTMPDHKYKVKCAAAQPPYDFEEGMFDTFQDLAYKQVKEETFMRFRLTDAAETLASQRPALVEDDNDERQKKIAEALGRPPTVFDVQRELRQQLVDLSERIGCERATVWMVNHLEGRLWNIASTQLGNSIISIRMRHGLAGKAASTQTDLVSNDAQNDANFLNRVDKATNFVTRSVLCVVLSEEGTQDARAIVQLINKRGDGQGEGEQGEFDIKDAARVRDEDGEAILQTCSGIALHQLLSRKDTAPPPVVV